MSDSRMSDPRVSRRRVSARINRNSLPPFCLAVTNRSEDEGVGLEDLDVLQNEIETMLVSVTRRQISIESDIEALNSWNESTRPASSKLSKGGTPVKSETTRGESRREGESTRREGEGKRKSSRVEDTVDSPRMNKRLKECVSSPLGSSASSISSCSSSAITASGSKLKQAKSKNISVSVLDTIHTLVQSSLDTIHTLVNSLLIHLIH